MSVILTPRATFGGDVELRQDLLAEDLEPRALLLADVVEVDLVEAERDEVLQPGDVLPGVGRDEHRSLHRLARHVLGRLVEQRDVVEVPVDVRREDVAAPLVVGDVERGLVVVGPRQVHLQHERPAAAGAAVGVDRPLAGRRAAAGRSPGRRPTTAAQAAVAGLTAAAMSGGGTSGSVQTRARSTVTSPSWLTSSPACRRRMTSTHSPQAGVADVLARPDVAGDVLVGRLAGAERRPEAARVHRRQRRHGLRDDRRVVALPRRVHARRTAGSSPAAPRRATTRRRPTGPAARSTARSGRSTCRP